MCARQAGGDSVYSAAAGRWKVSTPTHWEVPMRMMLKAVIDTEAGNENIRNGSMAKVIEQMVQQLNPEAVYFAPEDGQRSCIVVFDMADPSQIPAVSEPMFL